MVSLGSSSHDPSSYILSTALLYLIHSSFPRSLVREDGGPGTECRHLHQLLVRRVGEICREVNQVRDSQGQCALGTGHSPDEEGVSKELDLQSLLMMDVFFDPLSYWVAITPQTPHN